jgi:aminopeptidase N
MLRGVIGTEKFWQGIREYYRRYRDANASTDDFRRVMEEASGTDLGWFFRQWLLGAGSPSIEWSWRYDAGGQKVELAMAQTQTGPAYRLPLEVSVDGKEQRIEFAAQNQTFAFAAEKAPAAVEIDPGTWVLMEAKRVQ